MLGFGKKRGLSPIPPFKHLWLEQAVDARVSQKNVVCP
jgi:hypothetical protein